MNREELIKELGDFCNFLAALEEKKVCLKKKKEQYNYALDNPKKYLKSFDDDNIIRFIENEIGTKPTFIEPVFFKKKAKIKYEEKLAIYNDAKKKATQKYYEVYDEHRKKLKQKEDDENQLLTSSLKTELISIEKDFIALQNKVNSYNLLHPNYWKVNIVNKILTYLCERRADTIKEALNLYHTDLREDEYQRQFTKHQQEINEAIFDIKKKAEEALINSIVTKERCAELSLKVNNNANLLNSLSKKAEDAYSEARSASSRADDAYRKADDVEYRMK